MSEATIKIHVDDQRFVATGEGAGPVGALDNALRMAITRSIRLSTRWSSSTSRCAS